MITRIEIDGFKSFLDFQLDVPPFLALVGPNSSGKSNFLDGLEYLSRSRSGADGPLLVSRRGRPHELFHQVNEGRPVTGFVIRAHTLVDFDSHLVPLSYTSGAKFGSDGVPKSLELGYESSTEAVAGLPEWVIGQLAAAQTWFANALNVTGHTEADFGRRLLRLERELTTWRLHQPDPERLRGWSSAADNGALKADGSNLGVVLGRLAARGALEDLVVDLVALIPDLLGIEPVLDERRREWTFEVLMDGQGPVPSTLLSDGTLRVIALLAALHDPDYPGVLLIEEIENGLHPSRLAELLRRIQSRVTDLSDPTCVRRPLRQVILTTHSPVVVSELYRLRPDALVFLDTAVRVDPDNDRISRVTVAKPVRAEGEPGTFVSPRQVRKYLSAVGQAL